MSKIIIKDQDQLEEIKSKIVSDGPDKFHVIADFDRTLTKAFVAGKEIPSILSILRDEGYLTPDYPDKAHELFDHYHAIEIDPNVPHEEKKKAMHEWWSRHFDLLIASKLNIKDIEKAVLSQNLQLRIGSAELLKYLASRNIPLVILSSSGLGRELIMAYLKNQNLLTDNIFIISNEFEWDSEGFAVEVKKPIIHTLNKDESVLAEYPFYGKIENRKNVLLLGDSPDDIGMIEGFDCDNLIKIGFLNKNIEDNLELYQEKYDVVITDDGEMTYVVELIQNLFFA